MELLTAAQMRAIEQAAIASGEVTGLELMERAGRGVAEAVLEWRPELATTAHRAVVLCGPGNNGGDGFVVARLLKQRGWKVEVFLYGDEGKLPPDAAENYRRWREMGEVRAMSELNAGHDSPALVIDAIFGAGLGRSLDEDLLEQMERLYDARGETTYVAIDAPSGLCMDSGRPLSSSDLYLECFCANLTVTFHRPRPGHFLSSGEVFCGAVRVKSIGLEGVGDARVGLVEQPLLLGKRGGSHKHAHGHALILSGGVGKGGAARLAARAALRVGAGLATVGAPPAAIIENAAQLNAVMLRPVADGAALAGVLEDGRINAVALGMGFEVGERAREMAAVALSAGRGVVLDADVLTSFADDPEALFALTRGTETVLVPHMGEFARIFPDIAEKLAAPAVKGPAYSKVDAAQEAAARAGCVVLLKGADTVIADAEGRAAVNSAHYERVAPWLATAGSGDVLAGLIAGLLARGLGPMAAAETGAWLHVEAARKFGPGLIAEDLPEMLPAVLRDLGIQGQL
jgi:hydroxyethylthiazole kinase-like uncharacterized protein yjeF